MTGQNPKVPAGRNKEWEPARILKEYRRGVQFKNGLGKRGLYEQNRINERFFAGDQWHGAHCGEDRPLVRYNLLKRIGEYKMAVIGSSPLAVAYSADGVPNTLEVQREAKRRRDSIRSGSRTPEMTRDETLPGDEEISLVMSALSDYFRVTAERVKFDRLREEALRNAYCSGTGIMYTWWDESIRTGLYADLSRSQPITGDIVCEVLDVENVYFGDPNSDDIQGQPYLLIAQRRSVRDLRREAARWGAGRDELERIVPDRDPACEPGACGSGELDLSEKTTVLTRMWKERAPDGSVRTVKAIRITSTGAVVRPEWELGIRLYPLAAFSWERRKGCAYGESEITYLIPNQIAVNRMLTASVWSAMMTGMPIMVVDGDVVPDRITNDPGQIIRIFGGGEPHQAVQYIHPPAVSSAFEGMTASLVNGTLTQAGANSVALGDVRPDNTSAIIAAREASTLPLQLIQSRFYGLCEDVARIWAEFWVMKYGDRALKLEDGDGVWYLPFRGERYRDLLISVRIDVGASTMWSESQSLQTLDNLFDRGVIDTLQYLSRLPKGTVPDITGLMQEIKKAPVAGQGPDKEESNRTAPSQPKDGGKRSSR